MPHESAPCVYCCKAQHQHRKMLQTASSIERELVHRAEGARIEQYMNRASISKGPIATFQRQEQGLGRRTSAYSPVRRLLRLLSNTLYLQVAEPHDLTWPGR